MGCSVGVEKKGEAESTKGTRKRGKQEKGKGVESKPHKFDAVCSPDNAPSPKKKRGTANGKQTKEQSRKKRKKGKRRDETPSHGESFPTASPLTFYLSDIPHRQFDFSSSVPTSEKYEKIDRWILQRDEAAGSSDPLQNPQSETVEFVRETIPHELRTSRNNSLQLRKLSALELTAMMPGVENVKSSLTTVRVDAEEEREVLEVEKGTSSVHNSGLDVSGSTREGLSPRAEKEKTEREK